MYLTIIILPLLASIFSGFFGRKIGVEGSHIITCGSIIITTFLAIMAFLEVGMNNTPVYLEFFRWVDSESLYVLWGFNFDSLTVSMLLPVLIVSSLVHIYSIGYMGHDPHNQRFFSYLSLFTFMMIILVTANNFLLMFVGWEGVGICSYLLVSFWFTRIAANKSSLAAMLTNRVGDCLLTIGMFGILWSFGNVDFSTVFTLAPYMNENIIILIGICLLIGAMAKSSQVGLHIWLPMAMEGPTPVSALIHAATMVTAGVYLLIRSSPLIEYSSTILLFCLWIGAITTIFSSLIGLFQQDIKKVIAYSTMSQLGMMIIAVGLSSYNIALFHLVNHAFYKGLLFLGAGSVIHAVADNQDFRKYGGLKQFLPLTYSVMLIASLSLVAFPFMTGFYSKDFILECSFGQYYLSSITVYFLALIGAIFTTLYSIKVLYLTFLTNPNGPLINYKQAHEGDIFMSISLIILAIFSIFFGYLCKDIFIGLGSNFFIDNSIYIHPKHEIFLDTEFFVPTLFKILPLILTIFLGIISIIISEYLSRLVVMFKNTQIGYNIFSLFNQRFYMELLYNKFINSKILMLGGQTTKVLDKGSIELIGPFGLERGLLNLSKNLSSLDTGIITSYALYILIGLIFYLLIPYIYFNDPSLLLLLIFAFLTLDKEDYLINIYSYKEDYASNIDDGNKYDIQKSNILWIFTFVHDILFTYTFVLLNLNLKYLFDLLINNSTIFYYKNKILSYINMILKWIFYVPKYIFSILKIIFNHIYLNKWIYLFSIFMTLTHRCYFRYMLGQLGFLWLFCIFNAIITCLVCIIILGLRNKDFYNIKTISFVFIFSFLLTCIIVKYNENIVYFISSFVYFFTNTFKSINLDNIFNNLIKTIYCEEKPSFKKWTDIIAKDNFIKLSRYIPSKEVIHNINPWYIPWINMQVYNNGAIYGMRNMEDMRPFSEKFPGMNKNQIINHYYKHANLFSNFLNVLKHADEYMSSIFNREISSPFSKQAFLECIDYYNLYFTGSVSKSASLNIYNFRELQHLIRRDILFTKWYCDVCIGSINIIRGLNDDDLFNSDRGVQALNVFDRNYYKYAIEITLLDREYYLTYTDQRLIDLSVIPRLKDKFKINCKFLSNKLLSYKDLLEEYNNLKNNLKKSKILKYLISEKIMLHRSHPFYVLDDMVITDNHKLVSYKKPDSVETFKSNTKSFLRHTYDIRHPDTRFEANNKYKPCIYDKIKYDRWAWYNNNNKGLNLTREFAYQRHTVLKCK